MSVRRKDHNLAGNGGRYTQFALGEAVDVDLDAAILEAEEALLPPAPTVVKHPHIQVDESTATENVATIRKAINELGNHESVTFEVGNEEVTVTYEHAADVHRYIVSNAYADKESTFDYDGGKSKKQADVGAAQQVFNADAWRDRRTVLNPRLDLVLGSEYDTPMWEAAASSMPDHRSFVAAVPRWEYVREEIWTPGRYAGAPGRMVEERVPSPVIDDSARAILDAVPLASTAPDTSGITKFKVHPSDFSPQDIPDAPIPPVLRAMQDSAMRRYLSTVRAEDARVDESDRAHDLAVSAYEEGKQAYESAPKWRRWAMVAPTHPGERPVPERAVPHHPFGGMTRDLWIEVEREKVEAETGWMRARPRAPRLAAASS